MRTLLEKTRDRLKEAGISDYYRMAQDLVCHVFKVDAVEIMTRDYMPDRAKEAELFEYTELCASGKPIQYVINEAHFLDIALYVDHRVLIPRPETEGLADIARQFVDLRRRAGEETRVLDICTGSGCIGLYLAKHNATVTLSDISKDALDVAKWNASTLGLTAEFIQSDLFEGITNDSVGDAYAYKAADAAGDAASGAGTLPQFDIITANPPYIPSGVIPTLDINVRAWEPLEALDGGPTGCEIPDRIIAAYDKYLAKGGLFLMEIGDDQGAHFRALLPQAKIIQDLEGHDRIVALRKA